MLTSICAVIALQATKAVVTDYFPLNEGDEYQYEDSYGKKKSKVALTIKTGASVKQGDKTVFPQVAEMGSGEPETLLYWPDGDQMKVYLRVLKQEKLNGNPKVDAEGNMVMALEEVAYTVFKFTNKETKWSYRGRTALGSDATDNSLVGEAKYLGAKEVLGKKREVIEVTLDMLVGAGDGPAIKNHSVAFYARGVGLYESHDIQQLGKVKRERVRKLLAYTSKTGE